MAADFDFDGTYTEDVDEETEPDEEEQEEGASRQNRVRLILLILLVLVLLCGGCYLISNYVPLPIPGLGAAPKPTPAPAVDTPAPAPTEEEQLPATEEPGAAETTEEPAAVEPTEEPGAVEPTEEATGEPTEEATEELPPPAEPTEEATEEPVEPTATTVPVPGPTATPGPTVAVTVTTCDTNVSPTAQANGPYTAMMGKGQAVVIFDATDSEDPDGTIVSFEWDFGDGSAPATGESVSHGYTSIGSYVASLTVTDDCGDTGQDTAEVTIVGPTPPPDNNVTPEPVTPSPPLPALGTMGFCYRVQYGDTLSGIAWRFGVPLQDLALVNGVSMEYFVIAGQGLFIPLSEIEPGPNLYQVQPGDTLNGIAFHCGLAVTTLAQANGMTPDESLTPGQMIMIPPWNY